MTSQRQVFARSFALTALLVALACQRESDTEFDDSRLPSGSGAMPSGGSKAEPGGGSGAQSAAGGVDGTGDGGSAAGAGDGDTGGSNAVAGSGGKAGSSSGGGAGGKSEGGGGTSSVGGGGAGSGGKPPDPDPEPVTLTITDIADAHVESCSPFLNYGDAEKLLVDGNFGCIYAALIDPALEKIPSGAEILSAQLELTCSNSGASINVSYLNGTWSENAVRWMDRPEVGAKLANVTCDDAGVMQIDLTAAVKAWLAGEHHAYGVYLQSTGDDGTDLVSSEGDDAEERPALVVTYKPKK